MLFLLAAILVGCSAASESGDDATVPVTAGLTASVEPSISEAATAKPSLDVDGFIEEFGGSPEMYAAIEDEIDCENLDDLEAQIEEFLDIAPSIGAEENRGYLAAIDEHRANIGCD